MTLPLGRTYPVERGPDGRLIVDLAKCPPGRSQEEMQITLQRLADVFGVDSTASWPSCRDSARRSPNELRPRKHRF